ncbi:MAG: hypothetical protein LBR13_04230 [Dysgonamonadaceae bacterium]|jgi:hypothetical protein|nr:hypothetical protein [Dysgonamonadaceae bacterium]
MILCIICSLSLTVKSQNSKEKIDRIFAGEQSLKQIAQSSVSTVKLNPLQPSRTMTTSSLTTRAAIWGSPDAITISMLKTDIFDRRYIDRDRFTMANLLEGAYSEANKDLNDMPMAGMTRPSFFSLDKRGGRYNHGIWSEIYPFPCQKPVGQVIIKSPDFKGIEQPIATEHRNSGEITINLDNGSKKLNIGYLLSMEKNITAIDLQYENLENAVTIRLFRNLDTGQRRYKEADGTFKKFTVYQPADSNKPLEYYDFEPDKDKIAEFEPPKYGREGRFFWIEQVFPSEPTFPEGFRYVIMAMVSNVPCDYSEHALQKDLGTKPIIPRDNQGYLMLPNIRTMTHPEMQELQSLNYSYVADAPGVAVDATLKKSANGKARLYFAIVTLNETKDYFARAKELLLAAEKQGYEKMVAENKAWYDRLFEKRENGRILLGKTTEERALTSRSLFNEAYKSWTSGHLGDCLPNPSKLEGSASYAVFDSDIQNWHSLPCYNELFTEGRYFMRNQYEPKLQWAQLAMHWHETFKEKARVKFGLPGLVMAHGYLPPAKQSPWYVENDVLDYTMEVSGQIMKVIWNFWDYTGNEIFLRDTVYPLLKDLAIFYEAFARRGWDGKFYNLEPTVETESYGISYRMEYTRNNTGSITVFRKILNLAAEAADYLKTDGEQAKKWREVAGKLPKYPVYRVESGAILGANEKAFPRYTRGDHGMYPGFYPVTIADEINLDSPQELKDLISRTADVIGHGNNANAYVLVGKAKNDIPRRYAYGASAIESYSALASQISSVPERLMNSRSGRIHLFPAVPDWTVASFRNFLARGAFEVSAARDETGILAVTIKARRSIPLKLMNPWLGKSPKVTDLSTGKPITYHLEKSNGECINFDVEAGHLYSFDL